MLDLVFAELMKSRTRWLPYVLFIVMVLGAGVQVWLFGYTAWWDLHNELDPEVRDDLPLAIRTFTLPWGLPALVDSGQFWGSLIIGLFIASAVATEYNWGTVRQAIARGQSREEWLTVKLLGLALFCAVLLLIVLAWGIVSMLITSSMADIEVTLDPPGPAKMTAFDAALVVLRGGMGILPYALVAFALAVIGRSTALGAAGIILFMIIEATVIPIFGALPDPWPAFRSMTIGYNVSALLAANRLDDDDYASIAPREALAPGEGPDPWVGFFALCVWCAALLGVTYYVFARRDLRLGTGESQSQFLSSSVPQFLSSSVTHFFASSLSQSAGCAGRGSAGTMRPMEPEVRYCTTADGVRIAFTVTGQGPTLVSLIDPIVSHVALEWSHPGNRPMLEEEARYFTLVRLDMRGSGLSDRIPPTSIDEGVLDIEAVVERLGLERFTLHVNTSATPFAVAFAAKHPQLVERLVIIDGLLRSADLNDSPQVAAFRAAAAADWETATEVIGAIAFGAGRDENRVHGQYVRACVNADYFAATLPIASVDVTDMASTLRMPVLVVRHMGYRLITDEMTNHLMSCIPDARLVTMQGMWPDDIEGLVRRMAGFVYEDKALPETTPAETPPIGAPRSSMAVILFADIVDSTALNERMGDAAFRENARSLDEALRSAIRDAGGTAIDGKLVGDGVLATFPAASQAIDAALRCAAAGNDGGLPLHLGIHAGDVIREANNVYGGAVNIASRISALSAPGEVLVSDVVRGLARTSAGVVFEDRGEHALKGVTDPQRVYAVRRNQ